MGLSRSRLHTPISLRRQRLGRHMLHGVDVDLVFQGIERAGNLAVAGLDHIGAARQHRLIAHPQYFDFKLVGHFDGICRIADNIAAADIDLVVSVMVSDWPATPHSRDRRHR